MSGREFTKTSFTYTDAAELQQKRKNVKLHIATTYLTVRDNGTVLTQCTKCDRLFRLQVRIMKNGIIRNQAQCPGCR